MQPSSAALSPSPTAPAETPRSSYGLLLTWCAWASARDLSPLPSLKQRPRWDKYLGPLVTLHVLRAESQTSAKAMMHHTRNVFALKQFALNF